MRTLSEQAVRRYLALLEDPSTAVDHECLAELRTRLAQVCDPLDQLRLLSQLEREQAGHAEEIERDFIAQARAWALSNDVPPSAFTAMGVPRSVLIAAGLIEIGGEPQPVADPAGLARLQAARAAVERAGIEPVVDAIQQRKITGVFTVEELSRVAGVEAGLAKRAVDVMVADGILESAGRDRHPDARGRRRLVDLFVRARRRAEERTPVAVGV